MLGLKVKIPLNTCSEIHGGEGAITWIVRRMSVANAIRKEILITKRELRGIRSGGC